nr:Arc family DNA-binding protein [Pseudomonas sp. 1079]
MQKKQHVALQRQQGAIKSTLRQRRKLMKGAEKKVVGVRIVLVMRELLEKKATENGRSLSSEIVFRLRKSLEREDEQISQA